jgi:hypothetical protein
MHYSEGVDGLGELSMHGPQNHGVVVNLFWLRCCSQKINLCMQGRELKRVFYKTGSLSITLSDFFFYFYLCSCLFDAQQLDKAFFISEYILKFKSK